MAVGNVGETLAPYTESDTFLSRDAGFTWEEVHKNAHLWEFGDSGSILVMANDEAPTDHVLFSTNEGINWREHKFTDNPIRVRNIVTVPSDTSRRFILMGNYPTSSSSVVVHLDFSSLTLLQCKYQTDEEYFRFLTNLQASSMLRTQVMTISSCGVPVKSVVSAVCLDARWVSISIPSIACVDAPTDAVPPSSAG
jgi:hypothetical protein